MAKDPGQSLACLEVKTCPLMIVSKAPVVVSNPKNKPLSNSQEVLFTLLNKRFQRYLASQASTSVGKGAKRRLDFEEKKSAENEREVATHRLSLINHQGSQSPEGHGEKAAVDHSCPVRSVRDSTTLKLKYRKSENERQSAPTSPSGNVLNKLGCTELAEHVVNRAKVRLKRRPKRDVHRLINKSTEKSHQQPNVLRTPPRESGYVSGQSSPYNTHSTSVQLPRALKIVNSPQAIVKTPNSSPSKQSSEKISCLPDITHSPLSTSLTPTKTIYLSNPHSLTPKDTGIPNAPPSSPEPSFSQPHNYIHSMCDIKSQRQLKNRLQDLGALRLRQEEAVDRESKQEEKRKCREEIARLKARQRAEIYALNKIMRKHEEETFRQFISGRV